MIKDIISRLRFEGQWRYFEDYFDNESKIITDEMKNGEIKSLEDLKAANAKLELLDKLKNIDKLKN